VEKTIGLAVLASRVHDDPPRIDIDRLIRVWDHIEAQLAEHAVYLGVSMRSNRYSERFDGWNQHNWRSIVSVDTERCHTAMCLAGWTTQLDAIDRGDPTGGWLFDEAMIVRVFGDKAQPDDASKHAIDAYRDSLRPVADDPAGHIGTVYTGAPWDETTTPAVGVEVRARRLLGLTEHEADELFAGGNNLITLRGLVSSLIAEEKTRRRAVELLARLRSEQAVIDEANGSQEDTR